MRRFSSGEHFISNVFSWWIVPFLKERNSFSTSPYELSHSLSSFDLRKHIEESWTQHLLLCFDKGKKPIFLCAVWQCYAQAYIIMSICLFVVELVCALQALFLYYLVAKSEWKIVYAVALSTMSLLHPISKHLWRSTAIHMGLRLRVSVQGLLLKKLLLIDTRQIGVKKLNAKVDNIIQNLSKLEDVFLFTPYIFVIFIYLIITSAFIAENHSTSSTTIFTVAILSVVTLTKAILSIQTNFYWKQYLKALSRMSIIFEELRSGFVQIKVYCLENVFFVKMNKLRRDGKGFIFAASFFRSIQLIICYNYSRFLVLCYITANEYFNETLPGKKVLMILAFLEIFMLHSSVNISKAITVTKESVGIIGMVQEILLILDRTPEFNEPTTSGSIRMEKIQGEVTVSELNIEKGETACFTQLGAQSKETLVRLLTGEQDPEEGKIQIGGKISFSPKNPWLYPRATVKRNIIGTCDFINKKYQIVLNMCNLRQDIILLPKQELTVIGTKGDVIVTREQEIKLSLARALYHDADIYLIDESLDELRFQTSDSMLEEIISQKMGEGKSVIFFSTRSWIIARAKRVFTILQGTSQLSEIEYFGQSENPIEDLPSDFLGEGFNAPTYKESHIFQPNLLKTSHGRKTTLDSPLNCGDIFKLPFLGYLITFVVFSLGFAAQITASAWQYYCVMESISWSDLIDSRLLFYLFLISASFSSFFVLSAYCAVHCALTHVYDRSTTSLLQTMYWEHNKRETLLNLFSFVVPEVTSKLCSSLVIVLKTLFIYTGGICLVVIFCPYSIISVALMTFSIIYSIKKSNDFVVPLLEIECKESSLVEEYFRIKDGQILSIRSMGSGEAYRNLFDKHMNHFTATRFLAKSTVEALSLWVTFVSILNLGVVLISTSFSSDSGCFLALFISATLPSIFGTMMRNVTSTLFYVHLIKQMVNLSRNDETGKVQGVATNQELPPGTVQAESVVCDIQFKLVYLNFRVNTGELVGIVGTGSSTLPSVLCGLCKIVSGKITIKNKRNTLQHSLIPPNPFMFGGTFFESIGISSIREDVYSKALEQVEMKLPASFTSDDWNTEFTAYQKQLFLLAASIAMNRSILIIHSNSTLTTKKEESNLIRKARLHLPNSTIFVLTNRLPIALMTDRIMVFQRGSLMEFNDPETLLERPTSTLNSYINQISCRLRRKTIREVPKFKMNSKI